MRRPVRRHCSPTEQGIESDERAVLRAQGAPTPALSLFRSIAISSAQSFSPARLRSRALCRGAAFGSAAPRRRRLRGEMVFFCHTRAPAVSYVCRGDCRQRGAALATLSNRRVRPSRPRSAPATAGRIELPMSKAPSAKRLIRQSRAGPFVAPTLAAIGMDHRSRTANGIPWLSFPSLPARTSRRI